MRVLLMISAQCAPLEEGSRDCDRPLTNGGRRDAMEAAEFAKKLSIAPECVLVSPFQRSKVTGDIFAESFDNPPPVEIVPALMPGAGVSELMKAITDHTEITQNDWILVVIHYSDANFILSSLFNQKNKFNFMLQPGILLGLDILLHKGALSAKILFSKYP